MNYFKKGVWIKAVHDAEAELLRYCPTLVGGIGPGETPEAYMFRGRRKQEDLLSKLAIAREELEKISKEEM